MARGRPEARLFEPKRLFWVEAPSSPSDTSREKSPHGIGEASPPDERRTISPDGCWGASLHGCRVKDDLLRKVPFLVEPTFLEIKVPGPSLAAGFPTTCTAMLPANNKGWGARKNRGHQIVTSPELPSQNFMMLSNPNRNNSQQSNGREEQSTRSALPCRTFL
eukprot:538406-Rhodomonas_salina.3